MCSSVMRIHSSAVYTSADVTLYVHLWSDVNFKIKWNTHVILRARFGLPRYRIITVGKLRHHRLLEMLLHDLLAASN